MGPQAVLPSQFVIWNKIYGPAEVSRVEKLFNDAEKAVSGDPASLKRVKFMREQLWGKILDGAKRFAQHNNDNKLWTIYVKPTDSPVTIDGQRTSVKYFPQAWSPMYM